MTWKILLEQKLSDGEWTQRTLAAALTAEGVKTSYQTVQGWLREKSKPQPPHYPGLSRLLNLTAAELVVVTGVAPALGVINAGRAGADVDGV